MAFHKWVSTDTQEHDKCLVCGGMWVAGDSEHYSISGEYAVTCSGNTTQCHHYQGDDECWRCFNDSTDLVCERDAECNCLFCDS
jgi:hypothetical protein